MHEPRQPDCRDVERRLEALLDGRLHAAARAAIERHLATCPACRDLAEVVRAIGASPAASPGPDLTSAVLARTAGAPCARARASLCDLVDGALDPADAALVASHASRCVACGRVATALDRSRDTLRTMRAVAPDRRFVRDVMRATLGPDARWRLAAARVSARWERLVTRPRFGLEAAYVGAMVLFALFGLPFSPWRGTPERVLGATLRGSTALVDYSTAVGAVPEQVASLGDRAWSATGAQGVASLREARRDLSRRLERTAPAREALREDGVRLRRATREGDLPRGRAALQDLTENLGDFVRLITATEAPDTPRTDDANRPPDAGRG